MKAISSHIGGKHCVGYSSVANLDDFEPKNFFHMDAKLFIRIS